MFCGRDDTVSITTDASVYGYGAVLMANDKNTSYLFGTYNATDLRMLPLSDTPTSSDQQVLEALAMLVALRTHMQWRLTACSWLHMAGCWPLQAAGRRGSG